MNTKVINLDTGDKIQFEIIRKFSGEKRVYLGAELYELSRQLIKDGLRNAYPGWRDEELEIRTKEILSS